MNNELSNYLRILIPILKEIKMDIEKNDDSKIYNKEIFSSIDGVCMQNQIINLCIVLKRMAQYCLMMLI